MSRELPPASAGAPTLVSVLQHLQDAGAGREICRLVAKDGTWQAVNGRQLLDRALAYAEHFGPPRPEREVVGVALYHGLDLLAAFLGALWAGHIPTMLAPPSPRMEPAKYADSLARMLEHIAPGFMVMESAVLAGLDDSIRQNLSKTRLVDPSSIPATGSCPPWPAHPDEVAVLQHSSGTTGLQKGIALTHRAILEHNRSYAERIGLNSRDVVVSWLPLYHDMGFVACFLLPLLEGVLFVELSPFDWVQRPVSLLEQISLQRGTLCWLPNFAYAFLAQSVRDSQLEAARPDLSGVRAWINCSEPVQPASHEAFLERFGGWGVRAGALCASYAMAENVYAVTQSLPGGGRVLEVDRRIFQDEQRVQVLPSPGNPGTGLRFVSNGPVIASTELQVLGPDGLPLGEDAVGQLALRGSHLFAGYHHRPDLTAQAMTADGWYLTGDLGFVHEGEVYVTGRKKDLIIIQGRNYYPADVESVVGRVAGVIPGRTVAFGLPDEALGTERLVVLTELEEQLAGQEKRLELRIRNHIAQELDCTPWVVRVVPPRWLVKSTSGKLARADNRAKFLRELPGGGGQEQRMSDV